MRSEIALLGLGLLSFNGCLPEPPPAVHRIFRVAGYVTGFDRDPEQVEVHCGSGPRRKINDDERLELGWSSSPSQEENRAWGLDLPTLASHWEVRKPGPDGSFECGLMNTEEPLQLMVLDHSGRLATREIPLPTVATLSTFQAGEITPQETLTLEIDGSGLPATDLPLALMAGIERAEVPAGAEAAIALHLALLHRILPHLAQFAMGRGGTPVEPRGTTRIVGLPNFSRLDLYVTGPVPEILARRSVNPAANGVARISLTESELLGSRRRVSLSGVVRWRGGGPVPGATVVYSSYPDRFEIRSDADGRFKIPGAAAGRRGVLFVDARLSGCPPPFDRATLTQRLETDQIAKGEEMSIELPSAVDSGCIGLAGERKKDFCDW
jgi:hypothetical protein